MVEDVWKNFDMYTTQKKALNSSQVSASSLNNIVNSTMNRTG